MPVTIVNVTNGNVDLTNVPDNVIVENKGSGDVSTLMDSL